ncbi:MAG: SGNH/GDSL hydrolase family protein [Alphaproteobacteria bacterium]|nr:SGNH/GDSL hydrolase family protein [Alphaproteobacteria bacterium]MDE2499428.1 SGNH/GDSL hydrolase family protein [Alphaproteobacteria bacterium]
MRTCFALFVGLCLLAPAQALSARQLPLHWVGSWAAAQLVVDPDKGEPAVDFKDATLRQVVHLSLGGRVLRLRISNVFGTTPLHLTAVHIARPLPGTPGAIVAASDTPLTFSGRTDVTIPAGAEYVSDPVDFAVAPLSDLVVSMHFDNAPSPMTGHHGSRATSFFVQGDAVSQAELPDAVKLEHWYVITGVDVQGGPKDAAIVTFGDSITDGYKSTPDMNDRWPDDLARRLQASPATRNLAVLNEGIDGNRVLLDGWGPNALSRFDRDLLVQPGVRYLILLEGINDLGNLTREQKVPPAEHLALVEHLIAAYKQIAARAHAHGIKAYIGTVTPDMDNNYYPPDAVNEADRQELNAWIRVQHDFDGVIDFDAAVRDPSHLDQMLPVYDSGDHLHPGPAGYQVMGDAVPLALFGAPPKKIDHHKAGAKR